MLIQWLERDLLEPGQGGAASTLGPSCLTHPQTEEIAAVIPVTARMAIPIGG